MTKDMTRLRALQGCACGLLLMLNAVAIAQAHRQSEQGFTVQASTTSTENISSSAARKFGIDKGPHNAVINVTVMDENGRTVPADIVVEAVNLAGMKTRIDVRSTASNGWISYAGGYRHAEQEVLDFTVRATPRKANEAILLRFRERMPVR